MSIRKRHKIVLYNPNAVFFTMPLALLAVGSALDPELYEIVILDGRLEKNAAAKVVEALQGALCLGVTVLTGAPIGDAIEISRAAKRAHPHLPIVWGGWHPSMFGRECLAESCIDVTVQGQGEATFCEIASRLADGQSLEGCAGCTVRLPDGSIVENPRRELAPVASFRAPDYGLIPVERYFALKGKRQLDYISSQGCNFRCAFCSDPFVYGRKWVGLDPDVMGLRLQELWERYRFDDVNFQDETFFTRRDRVRAFAERLLAVGLEVSWAGTMRADQGVRMPDEIWALCRKAGLRRLLVGVESGSNEMLKRIRKDIRIEQVFHTAGKMRELGIAGNFPFIVGFPDESDESIVATLDCAKRLRSMSPDFQTPFFYFKPYPGSDIVIDAVRRGFELPTTLAAWSKFDFVDGQPGPWVSPEKFRLIERFKFFHDHAWRRPARGTRSLLQKLARYRCSRDEYRWPIEMLLWRESRPRLS